jgi:hypothetical protein
MIYSDDIDELKVKRICFKCVEEVYLSNEIEKDDYTVTERVPPPAPSPAPKANDEWPDLSPLPGQLHHLNGDFQENTLRIDSKSVEVHKVDGVQYQCTRYEVDRHRSEKRDWKF